MTRLVICACNWCGNAEQAPADKCPMDGCGKSVKDLPPIDMTGFPTAEVIGAEFVKVLREWSQNPALADGDYAGLSPDGLWAKMCEDNRNAAPGTCASGDWCDSNMAMDEAMRNLGMGKALDHPMWADNQAMADLWNAAWAAAGPALRGEQVAVS